jgi:dolichyl-diphosphooligosaccharide--protein glycosyltransferase
VDHHVAEVLFSAIAILFLILALKLSKERSISFQSFKQKDWKTLARPLLFALLSGLALGIYLLTWVGGVMIVFLFFCWAVAMFIIHHIRNENSDYISILGIPVFLVSFLLILPFSDQLAYGGISLIALIVGILCLPVLSIISRFMEVKNLKRGYYPLSLVVLGLVGLGIFYVIDSSLVKSMLEKFQVFTPSTNSLTISEVQPLFLDQGHFSLSRLWSLFTTASILAPIGFIFLIISE